MSPKLVRRATPAITTKMAGVANAETESHMNSEDTLTDSMYYEIEADGRYCSIDERTDIILRSTKHGIIPIVVAWGGEVWRGEFCDHYDEALTSAHNYLYQ